MPQNSNWNNNTDNNVTQRSTSNLNPMSNVLKQNRNAGTKNNNNGSIFGWGHNRKPTKNEQNYQKIEQ